MRALLITVAGLSSRFSKSLGMKCLKCIYYEKNPEESLLHRMVCQNQDFDRYIVVGGFLFEELEDFINCYLSDFQDRIVLVENGAYEEYGSGYSLYLGLREAVRLECDELVFAEGDLYVDSASFRKICDARNNVITMNRESIEADKAVAFYYDGNRGIHYIYDTSHSVLEIREPFLGIYNSGQIWKFHDRERLCSVFRSVREEEWHGTNLVFIQKYFENLDSRSYLAVMLDVWINCNTVDDFRKIDGAISAELLAGERKWID